MKVYVVTEYAIIEHEEYTQVVGVYPSEEIAREMIQKFNDIAHKKYGYHEYSYEDFEVYEG